MKELKDQSPHPKTPFPRCDTCHWWGHLEKRRTRIAGGLEQADCKLDPVPVSKSSSDYCSHHPELQLRVVSPGMPNVMMGKTVVITENAEPAPVQEKVEKPQEAEEEKPKPGKVTEYQIPKKRKKVTKKPTKPTKR